MTDVAVRVENLGKRYQIGEAPERYRTLRESIVKALTAPFSRARPKASSTIWALKGISFEVKRGDVIGVIGNNGAGKSTLLKILSRITEPTEGFADMHGRVASLLEVGTGFHPELSGRENIYLNGAILGMRQAEIHRKLDEIVAFAEVEKFLDTAVKHYSSGMYLRLAFSDAASLEPEILLVDEVLAVGDIAFQNKCLRRMGEVAGEGRTVLFVSHNLSAIASLTKRCLWLKDGQVAASGATAEVLPAYLRDTNTDASAIGGSAEIDDEVLGSVLCELDHEGVSPSVASTSEIKLRFRFTVKQLAVGLRVGFDLISGAGTHVFRAYFDDLVSTPLEVNPGTYRAECVIPANLLNQGEYFITLRASIHGIRHIIILDRALSFRILNLSGSGARYGRERPGVLNPSLSWSTTRDD
jgi:lipopolysaccharide transport system ATP-binding protein